LGPRVCGEHADEIRKAVRNARGDEANSLEDEEYRRRLQDKFGDRWRIKQVVQAKQGETNTRQADATTTAVETDREVTLRSRRAKRKRTKAVHLIRFRATEGGTGEGVERDVAVDVPKFRFVGRDEFDHPWHLALWLPNDPDGPTVLINEDSPILSEAIRHHQEQYPDVYAEEVAKIVRETYGEVAVCKIAHSQKLASQVPEEDLDQIYRSEAALTISLMGLLAEESLIGQRLGKLGRKKAVA
jgi:hypothetical protein